MSKFNYFFVLRIPNHFLNDKVCPKSGSVGPESARREQRSFHTTFLVIFPFEVMGLRLHKEYIYPFSTQNFLNDKVCSKSCSGWTWASAARVKLNRITFLDILLTLWNFGFIDFKLFIYLLAEKYFFTCDLISA